MADDKKGGGSEGGYFGRFIFALLATVVTILIVQSSFSLIVPDVGRVGEAPSTLFRDFGAALGRIEFPGLPGPPGVPDYLRDLFAPPTAPTGPTTLPPSVRPTAVVKKEFPWIWVILPLILTGLGGLGFLGYKYRDRLRDVVRRRPEEEIIREIDRVIRDKRRLIEKINRTNVLKHELFKSGAITQSLNDLIRTMQRDVAYLWEEIREIKQRGHPLKQFGDLEEQLVNELNDLKKIEIGLYRKLNDELRQILSNLTIQNLDRDINELNNLLGQKTPLTDIRNIDAAYIRNTGIIYLILICYDFEKREEHIDKELQQLFDEKNIKQIIILFTKDKFRKIAVQVNRLAHYQGFETAVIRVLTEKILAQIAKLEELKNKIRRAPTTPTIPPISPKYNPNIPTNIQLEPPTLKDPIKPGEIIFEPEEPPKLFIDLSPDFPPIKNQLDLNSCVSFAIGSMYEYLNSAKYKKEKIDISELFLYYYSRDENQRRVNVGTIRSKACEVLLTTGICLEILWSYEHEATKKYTRAPTDDAIANTQKNPKIGAHYALRSSKDDLIRTLSQEYPISIGIFVRDSFLNAKSYYDTEPARELPGNGHALVIVGYRSNYRAPDGKVVEAFKIRNSWGTNWGENGYTWINAGLLIYLIRERGDPPRIITDLVLKGISATPQIIKQLTENPEMPILKEVPERRALASAIPSDFRVRIKSPLPNTRYAIGRYIDNLEAEAVSTDPIWNHQVNRGEVHANFIWYVEQGTGRQVIHIGRKGPRNQDSKPIPAEFVPGRAKLIITLEIPHATYIPRDGIGIIIGGIVRLKYTVNGVEKTARVSVVSRLISSALPKRQVAFTYVPIDMDGFPAGAYTIRYIRGSPPGTTLESISPPTPQPLGGDDEITFTFKFVTIPPAEPRVPRYRINLLQPRGQPSPPTPPTGTGGTTTPADYTSDTTTETVAPDFRQVAADLEVLASRLKPLSPQDKEVIDRLI